MAERWELCRRVLAVLVTVKAAMHAAHGEWPWATFELCLAWWLSQKRYGA